MKRITLTLFAVLALFISGCGWLPQNVDQAKTQLQQIRQTSQQVERGVADALDRKAELDRLIQTLPEGGLKEKAVNASEKLAKFAADGQVYLSKANQVMVEIESRTQTATNWGEAAGGTISAVGGFLPPPYGMIATMAGALIAGFFGHKKGKVAGMEKFATATEAAKGVDGKIDIGNEATRKTLKLLLGPDGRAAVNRIKALG